MRLTDIISKFIIFCYIANHEFLKYTLAFVVGYFVFARHSVTLVGVVLRLYGRKDTSLNIVLF